MADSNKIPLSGSERAPMAGASMVGPTDPNQIIDVSIVLKQRRELKLEHLQGKILSHDEFASTYGADPENMKRVQTFASEHNLQVVEEANAIGRRTVKVRGTVSNLEKAFSVTLNDYDHAKGRYRGRTGAIHIPADLADVVQGVFGLDNRPQAEPHFRFHGSKSKLTGIIADPAATNIAYNAPQVAQLYSFPTGVNGAGQTIGIIELGGGYQQSDITNYFQSLGISAPTVTSVFVDGGTNSPTNPDSADAEVLLDIEVSGSIAPGANIVVYFTPNTSQGFQDAISTAIHDTTNNPSVVSISWGGPESTWTSQSIQASTRLRRRRGAGRDHHCGGRRQRVE